MLAHTKVHHRAGADRQTPASRSRAKQCPARLPKRRSPVRAQATQKQRTCRRIIRRMNFTQLDDSPEHAIHTPEQRALASKRSTWV